MDNGSEENFISEGLVNKLGISTTPHPYPYNIGWMKDGHELRITHQCRLTYFIKDLEDTIETIYVGCRSSMSYL